MSLDLLNLTDKVKLISEVRAEQALQMAVPAREMYLYECENCVLVFGVETAFEDHSDIVCPVCKSDAALEDAGCADAVLTREPERSE